MSSREKPAEPEPPLTAAAVSRALRRLADPAKAKVLAGFFKTGPGQYGEGDDFLGVTVGPQRLLARKFAALPLAALKKLLASRVHEERLVALLILVQAYERGDARTRTSCVDFYLANLRGVNNWDLVDASAPYILGAHLLGRSRAVLRRLARSQSLWERRVAIVATHALIRAGESKETFAISTLLLADEHDLIHKAVGWMLREVGKRVGEETLRGFLRAHAPRMPRTALRYAIERFSPQERKEWLAVRRAAE